MWDITNQNALDTWADLNTNLKGADEEFCRLLLDEELAGLARQSFIKRIHSRLNKVRAAREREELLK